MPFNWRTSEVFTELLFHFECPLKCFFRLFFCHSTIHFPAMKTFEIKHLIFLEQKRYFCTEKNQISTYIMESTDFGLMNIAIGYNWATWRRLIALPDTSKMQCLPWNVQMMINSLFRFAFEMPNRPTRSI